MDVQPREELDEALQRLRVAVRSRLAVMTQTQIIALNETSNVKPHTIGNEITSAQPTSAPKEQSGVSTFWSWAMGAIWRR